MTRVSSLSLLLLSAILSIKIAFYFAREEKRTAALNQAFNPTFLGLASFAILAYTDAICAGAGVVPGRALGALIRALRAGDNLDIFLSLLTLI